MTPRRRTLRAVAAALAAGALALAPEALAKGGAFTRTKHGDATAGPLRVTTEPRGDCAQCHVQHASSGGASTGGPWPYALFAPDDNALCATCHGTSGAAGSWQGPTFYGQSSHGTSTQTLWPGPTPAARPGGDVGKCVNCHDPHGVTDASGVVPSMTFQREEALCYGCHDGSPARTNVQAQFAKAYRHPISTGGIHQEAEGGAPGAYAASPTNNRHAECVDCHDPHVAKGDPTPPLAPAASSRLAGVGRVRVTNGAPGVAPIYGWAAGTDPSPPNEYELCFKCHSSWTTQPTGQSNLALLLNTANPSFHPVEARGKNANIAPGAFVNGWTWDRQVYCSDCHTSDDATVRGPHGSAYRYLLPAPYTASSAQLASPQPSNELCFRCHAYATYADPNATQTALSQSRFNPPSISNGHQYHVVQRRYPCYACHQSHGSTSYPALVVTGRTPGVRSYAQTAGGGSCTPSCHGSVSYSVNYAR